MMVKRKNTKKFIFGGTTFDQRFVEVRHTSYDEIIFDLVNSVFSFIRIQIIGDRLK